MSDTAEMVYDWIMQGIYVAPATDCFTWNANHGRLSSRDSAVPGAWLKESVPQFEHWHDLVTARRIGRSYIGERDQYAHLTEQIWLVCAAQSMKTRSMLYAALGHGVDEFPSPKALILPRLKDFKRILDNRVMPFFKETPQLFRLFPVSKNDYKRSITYQAWNLLNCVIYMLCGELADDLRSFPVCEPYFDEFDLLPKDVDKQGDPISLVLERQKTFTRSKLAIGVTTPGGVDGHGWRRLCSGSHERLFIKCPTCDAAQELHPDQLGWPTDVAIDVVKLKRLAWWSCVKCGHKVFDDGTKGKLITAACRERLWIPGRWAIDGTHPHGHWTPSADFTAEGRLTRIHPAETVIRSGHMNGLYSQKITFSDFAWNEAKAKECGNSAELVTHINTWRAEPSQVVVVAPIDMAALSENATSYHYAMGTCPKGGPTVHLVLLLDQQGNSRASAWFPYVVRAICEDGESWLVDAGRVEGFEGAEQLEQRKYTIGSDSRTVEISGMDGANGMMTVAVQQWSAAKRGKRIALCGRFWPDFMWRDRTANPDKKRDKRSKSVISGARVINYHSNSYSTELDSRMRCSPGSLKWNLPDDPPTFYLASLTAEEQVVEHVRLPGQQSKRPQLIWKPRVVHDQQGRIMVRDDNHWWDCEKMSLVLQSVMGWDEPIKRRRTIRTGVVGPSLV